MREQDDLEGKMSEKRRNLNKINKRKFEREKKIKTFQSVKSIRKIIQFAILSPIKLPIFILIKIKLFIFENQKELIISVTLLSTSYYSYLQSEKLQEQLGKNDQKVEIIAQNPYTSLFDLATRVNWITVATTLFLLYSKIASLFDKPRVNPEVVKNLKIQWKESDALLKKTLTESDQQLNEAKLKNHNLQVNLQKKEKELKKAQELLKETRQSFYDQKSNDQEILVKEIKVLQNRLEQSQFNADQYLDDVEKLSHYVEKLIRESNKLKNQINSVVKNRDNHNDFQEKAISKLQTRLSLKENDINEYRKKLADSEKKSEYYDHEKEALRSQIYRTKLGLQKKSKKLIETKDTLGRVSDRCNTLNLENLELKLQIRETEIRNQHLERHLEQVQTNHEINKKKMEVIARRNPIKKRVAQKNDNKNKRKKPKPFRVHTGYDGQMVPTAGSATSAKNNMRWEDALATPKKPTLFQRVKNIVLKR